MSVPAKDNIDASDPAGKLEIDIHAVMRQQDNGISMLGLTHRIDHFLHLGVANAESPIRHEATRMGNWLIGEALADDGNAPTPNLTDDIGLEHSPAVCIESFRIIERGLIGQEDVLRKKLAFEFCEVAAKLFFAIGHLEMRRHGVHTQQIGQPNHGLALRAVGNPRTLPGVAAIQKQRIRRASLGPEACDQCGHVGVAAHPSVAVRRFHKIEIRHCVRLWRASSNVEMLQECVADQMWRLACRIPDTDVDTRFPEIDRKKLSMRIGHMKKPDIATTADIVNVRLGLCMRRTRQEAPGDAGGEQP